MSVSVMTSSLSPEARKELTTLYMEYHEKWWCYWRAHRKDKRMNIVLKLSIVLAVATGGIVGGVSGGMSVLVAPVVVGVFSGVGLWLKGYTELKNLDRTVEKLRMAMTTYKLILNDIESHLRGEPYDHLKFIEKLNVIDGMIIDQSPVVEKFHAEYKKRFIWNND